MMKHCCRFECCSGHWLLSQIYLDHISETGSVNIFRQKDGNNSSLRNILVKTYLLMHTTSKILVKTTRIFKTCTPHNIFSGKSNKGR